MRRSTLSDTSQNSRRSATADRESRTAATDSWRNDNIRKERAYKHN